jgi:hypothetical protein
MNHPIYALAYGIGFALGTFLGVTIEQRLAFGLQITSLFTKRGAEMARALISAGYRVAKVDGHTREGDVAILYVEVPRKQTRKLIREAGIIDETCFCIVNDIRTADFAARSMISKPVHEGNRAIGNNLGKYTVMAFAWLTMAVIGPSRVNAIDYQPFDWVPLSPGTSVALGYYEFSTYDEYNNTIMGTSKSDTHLNSEVGIARYLYYGNHYFFDRPWVLDFVLPFGTLNDGKINGYRLGNASGVADPLVSAGYWLLTQPEHRRWISIVDFLTLPIGTYDKHEALNLGGNRWQNDFQADFTQGFLHKFTIDVSADWIHYWDNTEAGTGSQTLRQDATFGAYAWLSYDVTSTVLKAMPWASNAFVAVGYAGLFGGKQKLDGIYTGAETREDQIRLTYSQFITPTWQILVSASHDVSVSGQFKQDLGITVRISKLF